MDAPFTILDVVLFFIVIISGLLAMTRGFIREFFSIFAWVAAALVTYLFFRPLEPMAKELITNDTVAQIALGAILFIGTLVGVSILSYLVTDKILDSRVGALDRTLGFMFGGVRGFLLVVACYLLYILYQPAEKDQFTEVTQARSIGLVKDASDILLSALPEKPGNVVSELISDMKEARKKANSGTSPLPNVDVNGIIDEQADQLKQQIEQTINN